MSCCYFVVTLQKYFKSNTMRKFQNLLISVLMTVPILLTLSSCTVNDNGEFEFTGLFWILLIAFVVLGIVSYLQKQKEAEEKGLTMEELLEQEKQKAEKKQMREGFEVEYLGGYPKWPTRAKLISAYHNHPYC